MRYRRPAWVRRRARARWVRQIATRFVSADTKSFRAVNAYADRVDRFGPGVA